MRVAGRVLTVAVLVIGAAAAVDVIGDATQSRPDRVPRDSRSEIVMRVETKQYKQGVDAAAANLWAFCSGTTTRRLVEDPGIERIGPKRFRFSVAPGLGEHTRVKLVGCLEDASLDHVSADVESVRLLVR